MARFIRSAPGLKDGEGHGEQKLLHEKSFEKIFRLASSFGGDLGRKGFFGGNLVES